MLITEWLIVIQIYKNRARKTNILKKVYANAYPIFMDIKNGHTLQQAHLKI